MDITSVFKGLTTPTNQLHSQIHKSGWEVTKIGWDKKLNHFVAEAKSPHGETISKSGPDDKSALANLLIAVSRHNHIRTPIQAKIGILKEGVWKDPPADALQEIAKEYAEAPVYEPQAAIYFHELGQDSNHRAEAIRQQLKVSVVDDPEPYHSVHEMVEDIHKKQNFLVSRAHSEHPVWDTQTVVDFRIVHDVMGYAVSGGTFNYEGEVAASAAHAPLLSPTAQVALAVEGIYQTAYASHYRSLGPQKVFIPKLLNPLNGDGEAPHTGIHPSQMSVPTALPEVQHEPSPTSTPELGLTKSAVTNVLDPNKGWKSGISPLNQGQHGVGNAYLDHGDPLEAQETMDMARKIDTDWSNLIDGNGEPDYNRMKQAVVNAFRVVLLSPRKDLQANCHDSKTEVLTDRGWWSIDQSKKAWRAGSDFKVATYTNGVFAFETPLDMIHQEYEGEMIQFKGRYFDALVTPNHRMLTEEGLIEANNIPIDLSVGRDSNNNGYGPKVPTGGKLFCPEQSQFVIPGVLKRDNEQSGHKAKVKLLAPKIRQLTTEGLSRKEIATKLDVSANFVRSSVLELESQQQYYDDIEVNMDLWLDWLGWYISEGWLDGRNHPHICQKGDNCQSPRQSSINLWDSEGKIKVDGMWRAKVPCPYAKSVGQWISENIGKGARNKRLPEFVFNLSLRQANILLSSMIDGDGHRSDENNWSYYTSSKQLADGVLRLATLIGYRASINPKDHDQHTVAICAPFNYRLPSPHSKNYNGQVWCFTTPTGTLVTRRGGKTLISGNSIHYQDIASVPHSTTDPKVYWDTLEHSRKTHNQAQGIDPTAHMVYYKYIKPFTSVIHQMHPQLNYKEREAKAKQTLFNWWTEEQQRIETQDADKPADKQRSADEIERRANEALAQRMQVFLKDKSDPKTDVHHHEPISLFGKKNYKQHLHDRFDHVGFDNSGLKTIAKNIRERLEPEVPDDHVDEMMSLYAYLALTSGAQTTNEEVHDAWSYWTLVYQKDPDHKNLIPFDELDEATQNMDTEYRDAIRNAAKDEKISSWRHIAAQQYNLLTGEEASKYPAWMGTHLKAIAQISQHVDDILQAALTDVKEHDGAGHHFRAQVLQLKVSGVGPKVCSFAWLLLQPMTSQLATVDTHIMDVLGHNYEKEMNSRSYFKFERELAAGRDASGYSHVPLGTYQWGMWDHKRTGPGTHQDHSAMKVLDPLPHKHIDWAKKQDPIGRGSDQYKADWAKNAPDWWQNTKPAREQVADDWDKNVAPNFAQSEVPYQVTARLASTEKDDEFHIGISLPEEVIEKIARWTAFADLPDDIKLDDPSEYHMTVLWTEEGFDDEDRHSWVSQNDIHGIAFENARVHQFPARSDKGSAVVLRFDSPEGKKLTNRLMSEAKERGYEFKRFDGGWKPHITIGWTHGKVVPQKLDWGFRSDGLYVSAPRPLREDGDWFDRKLADDKKDKDEKKFSKGFGHWWQAEKPHGKHNATKMAEYAVGTKTSRSKAIDYVENHKEDVKGDYKEFKKAFIKKFDSMDKISKTTSHTPWFTHQDQDHQGEPGGTIMQHAVNTLGLSTPDIWQSIGENAGKNPDDRF